MLRWWWWFSRYSTLGAKRVGRADGRLCIPQWNDPQQPPYVGEIVQLADENIRALHERWHEVDASLLAKGQQLQKAVQDAEQRVDQAKRELEVANTTYTSRRGEPPPAHGDARMIGYWLLLLALFVFEFPINLVVFRLFGESELLTVIATAAIGIPLLACAHYLGRLLKEGKWDGFRVFMAVVLFVAPLLVVAAIAWLRQLYLSQVSSTPGTTPPAGMMYAFAAFNLIIFLVAIAAAYFVHDELLFNVYRARKQYEKAQRRLLAAKQALTHTQVARKKSLDVYYTKARQVKDAAQRLIAVYQGENLRTRPDRNQHGDRDPPRPLAFTEGNQPKISEDALNEFEQAKNVLETSEQVGEAPPPMATSNGEDDGG